ncbi:arylsulfatase [Filimonas effusa]|uniref:Arylsulfatase n=1 Tax=Filimonas effusa TaxID=2508721 RepID=A0A4Q1D405_9BACT|nr:arylsulfatase [Filimonas effusa]RXK83150.1 arylsulfatase [Filimonas effusa]
MKHLLIAALTAITINAAAKEGPKDPKNKRPNIILIVADDLGYSDLGAYGSEIATPNLDRLAKDGLRLQQFYNNSICAPTRASLLTGQYQHKAGVGYFSNDLGLPAYQGYINQQSLTLAEVLKAGGYTTITSGKWHVSGKNVSLPWQRGFQYVYPRDEAAAASGAPQEKKVLTDSLGYPLPEYFQTNVITKNAVAFLDEAAKNDHPFFLYLAYTAPHWPLIALPEDIAKYKGKYDKGWDALRQERFAKQKQLGIVSNNATLSVKDEDIYDWARLSYDQRQLWTKKMEVFAAMVDRLDQGVGAVLAKLKEIGADENTLIIFVSDNGAPAEDLVRWHHGASRNSGPVGTTGSNESQSKNWSYLSNTPFLGFKDDMHEGGINSPFIAWFPGKINAGTIRKGTGHIIDLAPTFYELAGAKYPATYNGTNAYALPGKSLLPVLFGQDAEVQRAKPLFWERAGNRAVRDGKWKLVSTWPSYSWELFNLEEDPGETKNVARENHEVVSRLSVQYFAWAKENGVVDFATLEDKEPQSMKEFRKSKQQEKQAAGGFLF